MNTKALRQKILDLAIHGKLVPQDPNDEPASVLLERIKAKKERLIKEGKIKRTKRSKAACDKPHYENEDFDIPNSWTMAEMSDLFLLNPKNEVDDETEVGFVPMACVEDGFSGNHSFETRKWEDVKKGYCHFQNGDIGVAKISPCFENLKSCILHSLPNGVGTGTTELVILRSLGVYVPFYMYLFKSSWYISQGTKYFKGVVGQQRVNKAIFTDLKVPLPSVAEQERIVAEIKRWFTFIDIIEHEQSDLQESIKQAESKILELAIHGKLVPQDPTDEPATELLKRINPKAEITCDNPHYRNLPKGWAVTTIKDMCENINGLWKGKKKPFVNVGVIRNANFTKDFKLDYSKIEYIDVEQRAFNQRHLKNGDLIVEKSGGSDNNPVGRAILYEGKDSVFSFSNFTMALRIKEKEILTSRYLYYFLLAEYRKGSMRLMQTQTTGLHNLILDKYMSMPVLLPPFSEQLRITEKIEDLFGIMDAIKANL